ncbi:MAG: hypothetical protein IJA55_03565 [Clostridia bacterium]|nr:hypothetical protein [Clostridia bacterium]
MGFLSVLATIGKILLGIVIFIVTVTIIILIIALIKNKKDEENERLVRESDEGDMISSKLLEHMLKDGRITKEKINDYRESIRRKKIRQYKSTVERADSGDKYAANELVECFKTNKLTPAFVKEIRKEIAKEKEEKRKQEAEKKRRIEEEIKKSLQYRFSNNRIVKNAIEEISNDMLEDIKKSYPYHIEKINIERCLFVYSNQLNYGYGRTVDFNRERLYDLNSSGERRLVAEIISEGIKKQILVKYPQDPAGNIPQIAISYDNCSTSRYRYGKDDEIIYFVKATINYTCKNHNYREKEPW